MGLWIGLLLTLFTVAVHGIVLALSGQDPIVEPIHALSRSAHGGLQLIGLSAFAAAHLAFAWGLGRRDTGRLWPLGRLLIVASGFVLAYVAGFFATAPAERLSGPDANDPLSVLASLIGLAMATIAPGLRRQSRALGLFNHLCLAAFLLLIPLILLLDATWFGAYERIVGGTYVLWLGGVSLGLLWPVITTRGRRLAAGAVTVTLILVVAFMVTTERTAPPPVWNPPASGVEPIGPGNGFLRGATWFGSEWAVNHWNTRLVERAPADFAALRADGFNTVVLVVPWAGFMATPTSVELDPERVRRLEALLELAREAELNVVLRLGYAWDASIPGSGGWNVGLWLEEDVYQGWLAYLAAIGRVVAPHDHVRFGFLSWEDLWTLSEAGNRELQRRLLMAERVGYRAWLRERHALAEVSTQYGMAFDDWSEVPIPERRSPAFALFFEFMNYAWIERFFRPAQAVFPRLSMEIRVDGDTIWDAEGQLDYYFRHHESWQLPGADWITLYWAPSMYGENRGETVAPETAAERLKMILENIRSQTGDRPLFIGQFLVEDYTPGFEQNGRLRRDEVAEFLALAEPVLRRQAHGYALWAWRDYRHNAIPSPDFSQPAGNWQEQQAVADEDGAHRLSPGDRLTRTFRPHEFHLAEPQATLTLCVTGDADGDRVPDLRVTGESPDLPLELDVSGTGKACSDFKADTDGLMLTLEATAELALRTVSLSGFTQPIGMRDVEGEPKPISDAWRRLNAGLVNPHPKPLR
ncbi:MAG: DUF998 domain-containing protein [Pseudomonadota bacterium]